MEKEYNNLFENALNAKVTVDVPDRVYINLFATIFLAATVSGIGLMLLKKLMTKKAA